MCANRAPAELRKLLKRQADRLGPAREWLSENKLDPFSSALEVGCGCGDVLNELSLDIYRVGLDVEMEFLREVRVDGVLGHGHCLPFKDDSFDLVYCHFSLMWFAGPVRVLREMARVSRNMVCCMAEYDYGARLDYPDGFRIIRDRLAEGIIADGGDPFVGRKMNKYFSEAGLEAETGAYSHVLAQRELEEGFEEEWDFIEQFTSLNKQEMEELKESELASIRNGTRFLFTPVFYAVSRK